MKVCIVTLHWAKNCGAYMQSYALGEKIKQLGHEVVYLKPDMNLRIRNAFRFWKDMGKVLRRRDFKYARMKMRFHLRATWDLRHFRQVHSTEGVDRFVLGSDVIWQINVQHIYRRFDYNLGLPFPGEKVFSYAPSANSTPLERFQQDGRMEAALKRMHAISVRDGVTRDIVRQFTDRPVELVCDPVLLHTPDFYRSVQRPCKHRDFILVYTFGDACPNESQIHELRRFANEKGKILLSFGANRDWCDVSLRFDFMSMSAYFDQADYVVTNTFHGTVFSILYGKKFVQLSRNKPKVKYILEQLNLSSRTVSPETSVESILDQELDHADVQARLEALRASSIEYLQRNLQ